MAIHSSRQTFSILRTEHIVELIQFIKKMIFLEHVAVIADLKTALGASCCPGAEDLLPLYAVLKCIFWTFVLYIKHYCDRVVFFYN